METELRVLVIGLGSMGKRRIRNFKALEFKNIAGFDTRVDRQEEVIQKYNVDVYSDINEAISKHKPNAFIISTPPQYHMHYAFMAEENNINCFIEASVVDPETIVELENKIKTSSIVIAPSCTMRYFPGPMKIKELIASGVIGKVLNFNYQIGQYLPDWHPWEDIKDFYVSKRETGGAREILPFELTWISDVFGVPSPLSCVRSKLTDMDADIDDIYHGLLLFPEHVIGNITIEVISRPVATRYMRILGETGQIIFDGSTNIVKVNCCETNEWKEYNLESGNIESGYIYPEEPYINEMKDFVNAVTHHDRKLFPNSLEEDVGILNILNQLETISHSV